VLEQEYEYFFGEKPSYDQIKFNKKQIREMGDLLQQLKLVREHKGRSRWHFLARCIDKTKSEKADPQQAVVDGLNCLLTHADLLKELVGCDRGFVKQITAPEVWHALLRVPVARRLLMEAKKLRPCIDKDADFIARFAGESAAINLLLDTTGPHACRMAQVFRVYP